MKIKPMVNAAALAAALSGGAVVGRLTGPGSVGVTDQLEVAVAPAPVATVAAVVVAPPPEPTEIANPEPEHTPEADTMSSHDAAEWREAFTKIGIALRRDEAGAILAQPPGMLTLLRQWYRDRDQLRVQDHGDLYGSVELVLWDDRGQLKDYRYLRNDIVNAGKNLGIRMLLGDPQTPCPTTFATPCGVPGVCASPAKFNVVGIGTGGSTATLPTHTACVTELPNAAGYARQQDTIIDTTGTVGQGKVIVTFGANNPTTSNAINESCLLTSTVYGGGTMLARRNFGAITKNAADALQLTWTVTLS